MNTLTQVLFRILFSTALMLFSLATTAGPAEDSSLARDVRTKFAGNANISTSHIEVKAQNGVITLTGMVDSPLQEKSAIETAETVRGVNSVQSYITIRGTESPQIEDGPSKTVVVPGSSVGAPTASMVNPDVETVVVPAGSTAVPASTTVIAPASVVPASSTVVVPTQTVPGTNTVVIPQNPGTGSVIVPNTGLPASDTVVVPAATVPATGTVVIPERTPSGNPNLTVPNLPPVTPQVPGALQP